MGRQHTRIFGSRPDTELVAIVGRGSGRVQAQAQAARTAGFTDIGAMLDAVQPDLVSICLPSEAPLRADAETGASPYQSGPEKQSRWLRRW
jgi:predicted dehydrogenase